MKQVNSIPARLLFVIPALIIIYLLFLNFSGSAGKPGIDLLGTSAAQSGPPGGQERQQSASDESAAALRTKAAELAKRESAVAGREQELAILERDLLRMRREIADERAKLEADKGEFERQEQERTDKRITLIAQTLKNTKASVAAAQLEALYRQNRVTALYVLSQIDSRSAGKIFSKFTKADLAARIMQDLKAWRVSEGEEIDTTTNR